MPLGITRLNVFLVVLTFGLLLWVSQIGLFPEGYFKLLKNMRGNNHNAVDDDKPNAHNSNGNHRPNNHNNNNNNGNHNGNHPNNNNNNNNNHQQQNNGQNTNHGGTHPNQGQPPKKPTAEKDKGAILVTGGMGHIGTALIKRLIFEGENVVSLDVVPWQHVSFFKNFNLGLNLSKPIRLCDTIHGLTILFF